ncbi:MAG: sigma-70 family RNA polymerase sigma factor [Armatimonadetes bacterium]|nr:sigma-70 family RNA polymerase sigma factor [Armatimonadota bacterium]
MATEKGSPDFRNVVDENYARVYNLLLRLVGDRDAAADLTQDTFVRACQAWSLFRGDCQVYTWLFRIAVNLARNYLDRQCRERRREPRGPEEEADVPDLASAPDGEVETRELGSLLVRELAALRPDQREIIVLRDVQGLSYEEIGEVLGCSVAAVKSKLFRARSVLRKRLSDYMGWEA